MRRYEPYAGRRMLLIAVDGCVAGMVGYYLAQQRESMDVFPLATLMALTSVATLSALGGYSHVLQRSNSWHRYCTGFAALLTAGPLVVVAWKQQKRLVVENILLAILLVFAGLLMTRVLLAYAHRHLCPRKKLWVLAEDAGVAGELAWKIRRAESRYEVKRCSGLAQSRNLEAELESVDAVVCPAEVRERLEPGCRAAGKELLVVPSTNQMLLYSASSRFFEDVLVLAIPSLRPRKSVLRMKRIVDVVVGSLLLFVAFPVMVCIYLAIKLETGGNGLFRQERRGLNGESFQMLKFRSMVHEAESFSGPVLACAEDPRVTRVGRFLRASRLDELPQLWNVLRGEMSLVGPRPEREFFARQFDVELPDFPRRTQVKPGLTGVAQVWGNYASSAQDKLRLDLLYIANLSLRTDLQILLQTAGTVLRPGASRGTVSRRQSRLRIPGSVVDEQQKA